MPNNWLNNRKRRPTHPGEILREDVLPGAGLTQDKVAKLLGVSRRTISEILHERRPVTTDMAHRLARAFGTSPEMWLGLQQDVDLWDTHHARRKEYEKIKRVATPKAWTRRGRRTEQSAAAVRPKRNSDPRRKEL